MAMDPNEPQKQDSVFWSLGVPLFLCTLGVVAVLLFLHQKDRWDRTAGQARIDLRHIPPEWIGYRQTTLFATPVPGRAISVALFDDSTFVIGSADPPMLSFFDDTGTLLRTIDLPEEPRAIVCGTPETIFSGRIVVAHPRSIVVYSAEGKPELSWELLDEQSNVRSLALTPEYFFAADTGNRLIYRFDADKRWVAIAFGHGMINLSMGINFELLEEPFDGFVVYVAPITMAFSPHSGLLYIANPGRHRVDVFTQDGIHLPELSWGEPSSRLEGFPGCCNPVGLAVLDDGRVLTVEKAISRIKIYRTDGTLDTVVAGPDVLDTLPPGITRAPLDPGGRYFAAVPLSDGRIAVFDFDHTLFRIFTPLGSP